MIEIPTKAKNDDKFTALNRSEKEIIVYAVLCREDNQTAFLRYNPHFAISIGKNTPKFALSEEGKRQCKNFWSYGKVREYRQAYEETLQEFFGTKRSGKNDSTEIDESRKENALKSLLNQVMNLVEGGDLDADTLKIVAELFKKVGFLKEDVERIIAPIRVLMARCSECRYRIGVESAVCNGEMLDMCAFCKCRKIAEEHGYRFNEGKDLLELPQEIVADLESKNDVKLSDILEGKIEN